MSDLNPIARGNSEMISVEQDRVLNNSASNPIANIFSFGQGWHELCLRFKAVVTTGSEANAVTDGLARYIKGITVKNSRGQILYNSIPGLFFVYDHLYQTKVAQPLDTITTGSHTWYGQFTIRFNDRLMARPQDTALDTTGYNNFLVQIDTGSISDFFGTIGTATVVVTVSTSIAATSGPWPKNVSVMGLPYVYMAGPLDPSSSLIQKIDRQADILVKRIWLFAQNSAIVGTPFTGTFADTTFSKVKLDLLNTLPVNNIYWNELQAQNVKQYGVAASTGVAVIDFCKDRSLSSALYMGDKQRADLIMTVGALSTSQLSIVIDAVQSPKLLMYQK